MKDIKDFFPHKGQAFTGLTCINCNHQWVPRVPKPKFCAACHSPKWDNKIKVARQHGQAVRIKHSDIGIKG
jgi:hypothetical protein